MASAYPGALDSFVAKTDGPAEIIYAAHVNALQEAVVAIETELGTDPAGSLADVKTRLAVGLENDGKLKPAQQVKTVGKANAQYTSISAALTAITDATASKPYVILVYPGIYSERVTLKDHVHVVGTDPRSCKIIRTNQGALRCNAAITTSISNLYFESQAEEEYTMVVSNGTLYMFNCIIQGYSNNYTAHIYTGFVHARNSQFIGQYSYTLNVKTLSTFRHCKITSSSDQAVSVGHGCPEFYYCIITGGGNYAGVHLEYTDSNATFAWCKVLKSGAGANSITAETAATDARVYLCALNAALEGDVVNLIGTPYNVVDADVI